MGYLVPNPVCVYFKYDLDWFYGISTIEGYSMPNPVYRYDYINISSSKYCYVSLTIHLNVFCLQFKCQAVSVQSIGRILSGATTPGQSRPGSEGKIWK